MINVIAAVKNHRWMGLSGIAIVVAVVAWLFTSAHETKEKPMTESHDVSQSAITLDMISDLKGRLEAISPAVGELTEQMQVLNAYRNSVEAFMDRQTGEYRDLQARVGQFQAEMTALANRFDDVVPRVSQLEHAAEAPKAQAPEPEPKIGEPFEISGLIRWGEQALVIVNTPGGYQSLGLGDGLNGWQVANIDTVNDRVTLRHLVSGREVVQSLWGQAEITHEAADED